MAAAVAAAGGGKGAGGSAVCHPERLGLGDYEAHHCGPVTALAIYDECVRVGVWGGRGGCFV